MSENLRLTISVDDKGSPVVKKFGDEVTKAGSKTKGASKDVGGFSSSVTTATGKVGALTSSVLGMGVGIAGLGIAFFKMATTIGAFDQSMASVEAVTQATSEEMSDMTGVARQLGATTEFSASQAASGMEFLGRAGFDANQIIGAMPSTLDLATAGQLRLADAANIASNIMAGFGIEAENFNSAADVLAATAASANTNVAQLGEGMKFVAPVAGALGISVGDTAAAMGVLSNAGLQASTAGTGLRRILSELVDPSNQSTEALYRLGVSLDSVNPEMVSITDIVLTLKEAGIGAAEAMSIFGQRGGPAILALTSQSGSLSTLTEIIQNSGGRAKEMADIMRDTIPGAAKELKSAIEEIVLGIGEAGLGSALKIALDGATGLVRGFGSVVEVGSGLIGMVGDFGGSLFNLISPTESLSEKTRRLEQDFVKFGGVLPENIIKLNETRQALIALAEIEKREAGPGILSLITGYQGFKDILGFTGEQISAFRERMSSLDAETLKIIASIESMDREFSSIGENAPLYLEGVSEFMEGIVTTSDSGKNSINLLKEAYLVLGSESSEHFQIMADAAFQAFETIRNSGTESTERLIELWAEVSDAFVEAFGANIPSEYHKTIEQMEATTKIFGVAVESILTQDLNKAMKTFKVQSIETTKEAVDSMIDQFKKLVDSDAVSGKDLKEALETKLIPAIKSAWGDEIPSTIKAAIQSITQDIAKATEAWKNMADINVELRQKNDEFTKALEKNSERAKKAYGDTEKAARESTEKQVEAYQKNKEAAVVAAQKTRESADIMSKAWKGYFHSFSNNISGIKAQIEDYQTAIKNLNQWTKTGISFVINKFRFAEFQTKEYRKALTILEDRLFTLELQTWDVIRATTELSNKFQIVTAEAKELARAYTILGVTSAAELQEGAIKAAEAFTLISEAGIESADRLEEIWLEDVSPLLQEAFGDRIPNSLNRTIGQFLTLSNAADSAAESSRNASEQISSTETQFNQTPVPLQVNNFTPGTTPNLQTLDNIGAPPVTPNIRSPLSQEPLGGLRVTVNMAPITVQNIGLDPRFLDTERTVGVLEDSLRRAIRSHAFTAELRSELGIT